MTDVNPGGIRWEDGSPAYNKQVKKMTTNYITCDKCHEKFEWEEPEGYDVVDLMPDGSFISGDWICLDCGSCPVCFTTWVERRCDCDPPQGPLYDKFTGAKNDVEA